MFYYNESFHNRFMWDNQGSSDFGAGLATTAQNTGQSAINNFDPTAAANSVRSGFNTLGSNQLGTTGGFTNQFISQIQNQPQATGLYTTANKMFNVPTLANNAAYLENQVTNQLPQQYQLAKGFDVSDPQVQNAANVNLRFLEPQATAATNQSQTAQDLAGQYVQAGMQQNQLNTLPYTTEAPMIQSVLASQATGYNTAAQQELQGLQDKMDQGIQLSSEEMTRANQLLAMQEDYNKAIAQTQGGITEANIKNQYQTLNPAQTLINTFNQKQAYPYTAPSA